MSNSFNKNLRDKYIRCSKSGDNVIRNKLRVPKKNRPKKIITLITVFCYYKLHCFCRLKQSLNIELNFSYSKLKDQLTFLLK